ACPPRVRGRRLRRPTGTSRPGSPRAGGGTVSSPERVGSQTATLPVRFVLMPDYEHLEIGVVYRSRFGRPVLEADNVWFTLLTLNTNPVHFDAEYAAGTEWKRPLVDSTFTLALVPRLSVLHVPASA